MTPEAFLNAARCLDAHQSASDWMLSGKLARPMHEPPDPLEVCPSSDGGVEHHSPARSH